MQTFRTRRAHIPCSVGTHHTEPVHGTHVGHPYTLCTQRHRETHPIHTHTQTRREREREGRPCENGAGRCAVCQGAPGSTRECHGTTEAGRSQERILRGSTALPHRECGLLAPEEGEDPFLPFKTPTLWRFVTAASGPGPRPSLCRAVWGSPPRAAGGGWGWPAPGAGLPLRSRAPAAHAPHRGNYISQAGGRRPQGSRRVCLCSRRPPPSVLAPTACAYEDPTPCSWVAGRPAPDGFWGKTWLVLHFPTPTHGFQHLDCKRGNPACSFLNSFSVALVSALLFSLPKQVSVFS